MTGFCGSPIFDSELWNQPSYPDLSPCLQLVVGSILPPLFLAVISTCRFYHLYNSNKQSLPHHWLSSLQSILSICLCIPSLADLFRIGHDVSVGVTMYPVDYVSPVILTLGMILSAVIVQYERKKSGRYFGGLFAYWLMLGCFDVFILYSKILRAVTKGYIHDQFRMATFVLHFGLVLAQLALAFVSTPSVDHSKENSSPELTANYVSRITFWWFTGLVVKGYKRPLEEADLWTLSHVDRTATWVAPFEREWRLEMGKCLGLSKNASVSSHPHSYQQTKECSQLLEERENEARTVRHTCVKEPSLIKCLVKVFWPTVLMDAIFKLMQDILLFLGPVLLKAIINFTKDHSEPSWRGYVYAILMFVVALSQTTLLHQYFLKAMLVGMRLRSTICAAVYNKALKLTSASRSKSTAGEIVNLMSVDAQRFNDIMTYVNLIWSAPLQITIALCLLWQELGASVLAGMAIMVLMIPLNLLIANISERLQVAQMKEKDQRVKLMNEMLSGMKVLKLYAWEPSFNKIISDVRERELALLRKSGYLNAFTTFFWNCSPFLVACTTFAVFTLSNAENTLDAEKAFVSLSLFNIMRFPISMLPTIVSQMIETSVSVKRLVKFLSLEEMNCDQIDRRLNPEVAVEVTDGSFTWKDGLEETPTLDSINLTIKPGELVAVVGVVGSGKSSLISALLGDMAKVKGRVSVSGSVAYVPQHAWIQNASLKDNILFGSSMKATDLDRIIDACALRPDLDMLPAGENTEIGEKGINLSGGQKQRVSLARAVYSGADIYLLDDPLSAVDSHVGKHIFERVIGPNGCLSRKTRILVTHGISFLPQMDRIVVLKDGRVSEIGSFDELVNHSGAFAQFLKQYFLDDQQGPAYQEVTAAEKDLEEKLLEQVSQVLHEDVRGIRRQLSHTEEMRDRLASVGARSSKSITGTQVHGSQQNAAERMSLRSHASQLSLHKNDPPLSRDIVANEDEASDVKVDKTKAKLIEKETMEKGRVKLDVFKAYMAAVGWFMSFVIILCYVMEQGLSISANFWLMKWSDDVKTANTNVSHTKEEYLGVYASLGFGQGVLSLAAALLMATGSRLASRSLHISLLDNILHCPMMFFDTTPSGRILNRFTKDVSVVDGVIPMVVQDFLWMSLTVLATLIVICVSTPWFVVVLVPLSLLYFFIQRFFVESSRQLKRLESVALSPIFSHFDETVQGAATIKAFNRQKEFVTQSMEKIDAHQKAYYPIIISKRWLAVRLEFVGTCITLGAVIMAVISRNSGTSTLTAGLVGLSITYALSVTSILNWMVRMTSELETNIVAVERIKEYAEVTREADWINPNNRPRPDWPDKGDLVFDNYSVRYREGLDLVLKGITCNIKGGEKVGIVGRTGAGKSSLTLALFRILEAADGAIFLDDIRIGSLGLHDLRKALTIIPQDPVLFSDTLRMNLDPFDQYSDDNLWKAVEMAHLKTFVSSLADGLQYKCSEGGANLSVGQRQLVCLARALLRHTKVLILDEATAAVDLETDDLIQSTIRTAFADSTVLTIAHRLNTIMDYDRIMVLDEGRIKEFSAPGNLLQNKESVFYNMAKDAKLV